jgi:hypothetical protein
MTRTSRLSHRRRLSRTVRRARTQLNVELLEDRSLPSNGQWLAALDGLRGTSRDEQMRDAIQRLHAAQIEEADVRVIDHVGVDGIVVLQTPPEQVLAGLNQELQGVRGFRYVEAYDPLAEPGERISQFPTPPRVEEMLHEEVEGSAPAQAGPLNLAPATGSTNGPNVVNGLTGFNGIDSSNSFCGCSPPDTIGAAGPGEYIETVNTSLALYDKSTGALLPGTSITSFGTFFSPLGGALEFSDPIIVYNDITQHFFIGLLDFDFSSNSRLDVAISKTNNPTGLGTADWDFFRFNVNDGVGGFDFADYPKIGYDADGYVVSFNMFPGANFFDHSSVLAISNSGTSPGIQVVPNGMDNFTMAPARMHAVGANTSMWFVETVGAGGDGDPGLAGNQTTVVRMDTPFAASPSFTFTNLTVPDFLAQPSPLGGRTGLGTRMYHSALRTVAGVTHLVAAHSPGVQDGADVRSRVRWYDIDVTDPNSLSIYQQGEINQGTGIDTWFPDFDIAPDGTIGGTFSQSDPTIGTMDMYVTGRRGGDTLGTMQTPILAVAGTEVLDAFGRAGDYSFTTVDPVDGTFWAANEYSANFWSTWIQHFTLGLGVSGSTPANGSTVSSPPANFVVNFSDPVDPASLQPSDLTVNGQAMTGVALSVDHTTATFTFTTNPVTAQGLQTMAIAAGAITRDGNPAEGIQAFNAVFRWDTVPLTVTSTNPAPASTIPPTGPLTYVVNFNDDNDILAGSVDVADLTLDAGTVTSAARTGPKQATYTIDGLTAEGTLNVGIAAGALTDSYGNPNQAFAASYTLDFGTVAYPVPLLAEAPRGALVYDPSASGLIVPAGDTDSFTLAIDAGQKITVLVTPAATLQPTVTLTPPSGPTSSATAAAAGKKALLQTVTAAVGGTYTVTVSGAGGTTGNYTVQVMLGAALEAENNDGAPNNTPGTAQNLDASFTPLVNGATRGAVVGQTDATAPTTTVFLADFESGTGNNAWTISNGKTGLWHLSTGRGTQAGHTATHSSYFGKGETANGGGNYQGGTRSGTITSPAIALPAGQLTLGFNYVLRTQGSTTKDLARLQIKPTASSTWTTLASYNGVAESSSWRASTPVDVSAYAGQTVQIRFLFDTVDSKLNNFEGWYVDDVRVQQALPHDNYSFTVGTSRRVTVVLKELAPGDINVLLRNAAGTSTLATGTAGPANVDKVIYNYGPLAAGTYNLAITGQTNTPYSLVVTLGAVFDAERNDTYATAQDMNGVVGSLGYLGGEAVVGYFTDFNESDTGPEAAIVQAGFTAVHITDISTFDLNTIDILMVDESDNSGLSSALSGRLSAIQSWVQAGGVFLVHDRFVSDDVSDPQSNPFLLGASTTLVDRDFTYGTDLDVIPPGGTLVTNGPFGTITDTSLDGGNYSNHGFVVGTTLPAGATAILRAGPDSNQVAAFSYSLGGGAVYYSTIPLDWYLDGNGPNPPQGNFAQVYTPNMLVYGDSLNPAGGDDWYSVTATAGQTLHFFTTTPGDDLTGEPRNTLDPHIQLYYTSTTVPVATGTPLADGRNEQITYTVAAGAGGTYRIRVTNQGNTQGEYFLDPDVLPTPAAPIGIDPAGGAVAGKAAAFSPPRSVVLSAAQITRALAGSANLPAASSGSAPGAREEAATAARTLAALPPAPIAPRTAPLSDGVGGRVELPRPAGSPLRAATTTPAPVNESRRADQVQPLLAEALACWQAAGIDTSALHGIDVRIADLGGLPLRQAAGEIIWLDDNAAGWGWFAGDGDAPWIDHGFVSRTGKR